MVRDEFQERTEKTYGQLLRKEYAPQFKELEKILVPEPSIVSKAINEYDWYKRLDYISIIFLNSRFSPNFIVNLLIHYQKQDKKKMADLRGCVETPSPTCEIMDAKCRSWRRVCFESELLVIRLYEKKEKSILEKALDTTWQTGYNGPITRFATDSNL